MSDMESELNHQPESEHQLRLLDPSDPEAEGVIGSSDDPIILRDGENAEEVLVLDPITTTPDDTEDGGSGGVSSPEQAISIVRGAIDTWMSGIRDLIHWSDNNLDVENENQRSGQLRVFDRLHSLVRTYPLLVLEFFVAARDGDMNRVANSAAGIAVTGASGLAFGALSKYSVVGAGAASLTGILYNQIAGGAKLYDWEKENLKKHIGDDEKDEFSRRLGEEGGLIGIWEKGWRDGFDDGTIEEIIDKFNRGESHASPIILDLDGSGISTVGLDAGVQFDHNGDGFAQATGWVGPEDALLAMDLTGNEEIETGSELFGNASEIEEGVTAMNGFEALAIHDTNGNGRIDPGDEAWGDLRLWQDANGNGVVDEGELLTLDEVGIGSIDLGYSDSSYVDEHGNEHRQIGRFEWADGREGEATDVWFIQDTAITEARERLDVPEEIATLPDLMGYGEVHDLHQALVRPAANAPTFGSNFDRVA